MSETETRVAEHYTTGALMDRIRAALAETGADPDNPSLADLKGVDEFHTGGVEATERLLESVEVGPATRVLDIGCGLGGTLRLLADRFGATGTGVDLTPDYIEAARQLTEIAGVEGLEFRVGSALDLPVEDDGFDLALLLHAGMNIEDKRMLFAEAARTLKPGGTFLVFDVMRGPHEEPLSFPVPWAGVAKTSFVEPPSAYARAAGAAGFEQVGERDHSDFAADFFARVRAKVEAEGGPPPVSIFLLMGPNGAEKIGNYVEMLHSRRIAPTEMVFRLPH